MTRYVTIFVMVLATISFAMSQTTKVSKSEITSGGFTITATAGTGGSITPFGAVNVPTNGDQPFTITADAGNHIDSVLVDGVKTDSMGSYTFTNVSADHTIDAYFSINTYTLTYTAGANGSITGTSPQTVNHGGDGTAVTAVADAGYHFVDWSDASTVNPRTDMNVTSDITVTANFAINTYTLTYTAGANGSITGTSPQTVNHGGDGTAVTAVADGGYHFVDWSDASTDNPRTDMNVQGNISVTANFAINTYTLTYTAGANGSITGTSPQTVNHGGDGTAVTAVADAGYHFVDWSDASTDNPRTDMNVQGDISVTANFALNMVDVMFSVDMRVQVMRGNFNPSEDTAYVGGNFTNSLYATMTDGDNDSVYTFTYSTGYPGDTLWFKFGYYDYSSSNVALESDPTREFIIPMGGGSYSDYFDRDSVYNPPIVVNFNANMWVKIKKGAFDPAADILVVSGDFNSWGEADTLKDADSDSTYSIALQPGDAGTTLHFKFRYYDVSESNWVWENDPNREYVIPTGGGTYEDYFNKDSVFVEQHDIQVSFAVNMELERLSGRFDPAEDTVSVNGSFNGWASKQDILLANPLNTDLYEATFTIRGGVGESFEFKFWYEDNNWESVSNRVYTFTQSDINSLTASISESFNDGSLETVINQNCIIKFTCNTVGAKSSISGNSFPVVNSVWIAGSAQPLQWPGGGWPDADSIKAIRLYDDGTNGDIYAGDMIFSRDITFAAYTPLNVKYKYGINWGDAANNEGGNDNESGFAQDHTLPMSRYMSGATVVDTFGTWATSDLRDINGIGDENSLPVVFGLSQNYPNPFNPTTTINYSLAATSPVVLKVYDMLGREVETLVNGVQQTGTYTLSFSPKNLPSGIYYYRLTTNNFVETKTMMYVK